MAIFNNFPYVNTQELNLDYLIKRMEELLAEWRAISSSATATAEQGAEVSVTVDGNIKDGLVFHFVLPADVLATTSQPGNVQPDGESIDITSGGVISVPQATTSLKGIVSPDGQTVKINSSGVISSYAQGTVLKQESGSNTLSSDTFTKVLLNARDFTFGRGDLFSLTQGGVRVNASGVYLVEASSWLLANDLDNATTGQIRILKGASYDAATAQGWGITQDLNDAPVSTTLRVLNLSEGDIIFMDVAITGSSGIYKYADGQTKLSIVKIA